MFVRRIQILITQIKSVMCIQIKPYKSPRSRRSYTIRVQILIIQIKSIMCTD